MVFTPKELQDFLDFDPENGKKGAPGKNAKDGEDAPKILGISQNAKHELIITLDDGEQFNVGKLPQGDKGDFIKGDKGDSVRGDKGDSIKGDKGDSIKGDKGDKGKNAPVLVSASKGLLNSLILKFDNGDEIDVGQLPVGKEGDPGDEGVGFVGAKIIDGNLIIERSDGEAINVGRVKGERGESIHTTVHKGGTGPSTNPHRLVTPGQNKGDILGFDGKKWNLLPISTDTTDFLRPNSTAQVGFSWQAKGFSYLTDDTGAILTDEAGNALEGKDTVDANLLVNNATDLIEISFADSPYSVKINDGFINVNVADDDVVINMLPLSTNSIKPVVIRQDGTANTIIITPAVPDLIDDASTLVISGDGNAEKCVPFPSQWRTFT